MIYVNMYHVSAQGVDERMINVHYYYYFYTRLKQGNLRWVPPVVWSQGTFAGVPLVQCQHRGPSLRFHWYSVSTGDHDHFCVHGTLTRNSQRGRERWLPEPPRQALSVGDSFDSVMVFVNSGRDSSASPPFSHSSTGRDYELCSDTVELNVLGCRVDILGTNCDQWFSVALRPQKP